MKIIVFNKVIPRPDISSGERRFTSILEILALNHQVDLCITDFDRQLSVQEYEKYKLTLRLKGINLLPLAKKSIRKALSGERYDIGFFEFYWLAEKYLPYFWLHQPSAVTIVDSVDVHFAREESQAKVGLVSWSKAGRTKKKEIRIYRDADIVIAVSEEDHVLLTQVIAHHKILLIPNIVPSVERSEARREPILVFIGSYAWPPNVDAMEWFTDEIWPVVYEKKNDVRLQIIGSSVTPEITDLKNKPGVEVLGYVSDTTRYLEKAAISIAPLRFGGGMKGKVNEALANGIPVVTTSIGAQGFCAKDGEEMMITDDPLKFAEAILMLIDDPGLQSKIGRAGQALNERFCSPRVVGEKIAEMITTAEMVLQKKTARTPKLKILKRRLQHQVHMVDEIIRYNKEKYLSR